MRPESPSLATFACFLAHDVSTSTIHISKGFLVMCYLCVIIASIWLALTKIDHQNFALASRAMQIDLSDNGRQPQNSWGLVVGASNEVAEDWCLQKCDTSRAPKSMIGQWLSHQAFAGYARRTRVSGHLIRPVAERNVVVLPRSEKQPGSS
jgi:hypothetical protein